MARYQSGRLGGNPRSIRVAWDGMVSISIDRTLQQCTTNFREGSCRNKGSLSSVCLALLAGQCRDKRLPLCNLNHHSSPAGRLTRRLPNLALPATVEIECDKHKQITRTRHLRSLSKVSTLSLFSAPPTSTLHRLCVHHGKSSFSGRVNGIGQETSWSFSRR